VYDATDNLHEENNDFLFLETVSDIKLTFFKNGIKYADRACQLYITLGHPVMCVSSIGYF
jgi:hypothetical protein